MNNATASSLVDHINRHSARFSAWTLDFSERTWVILRDAKAPRTASCEEPILNVRSYLDRLDKASPVNAELHGLLELWLQSWHEDTSSGWQMDQPLSRLPLASVETDSDILRVEMNA